MIGRRGPVQAAFSTAELRELTVIPGINLTIADGELPITEACKEEMNNRIYKRKFDLLTKILERQQQQQPQQNQNDETKKPRKNVIMHFLKSPVEILEDPATPGRVAGVKLVKNSLSGPAHNQKVMSTSQYEVIPTSSIFVSVGYHGARIEGLPFDEKRGIIPNLSGAVVDESNKEIPGLFVAGWAKRGPTGTIASNVHCAQETVSTILERWDSLVGEVSKQDCSHFDLDDFLEYNQVTRVSWDCWLKIKTQEEVRGRKLNKLAEKFLSVEEMLNVAFQHE